MSCLDGRVDVQLKSCCLGAFAEHYVLAKVVLAAQLVMEPARWRLAGDGLEHVPVDEETSRAGGVRLD